MIKRSEQNDLQVPEAADPTFPADGCSCEFIAKRSGDDGCAGATEANGADRAPAGSRAFARFAVFLAMTSIAFTSFPAWPQDLPEAIENEAAPSGTDFESLADRISTVEQESIVAADEPPADAASPADGISESEASALSERIDQIGVRLEAVESNIESGFVNTRARLQDLESQVQNLELRVGQRLDQFEMRHSDLESDRDRADQDLATRLLLIETDALFAIAQDQLVMSGDREPAVRAWRRALQRLSALAGAEFDNLKAIAKAELDTLQAFKPPDIALQVRRLYEIADEIEQWPVPGAQPRQNANPELRDAGWRDRLGNVLDSLVQVEKMGSEFPKREEIELARERIPTMLQTAALALLRSRPELARGVVEESTAFARRVFATDSTRISRSLQWLDEFAEGDAEFNPPSLVEARAEIARLLGAER